MKYIALMIVTIACIASVAFAETYTVSVTDTQQEVLMHVSQQMKQLPDECVQTMVTSYLDGMMHKAIEDAFMMLSPEEREKIAYECFPENLFNDPYSRGKE